RIACLAEAIEHFPAAAAVALPVADLPLQTRVHAAMLIVARIEGDRSGTVCGGLVPLAVLGIELAAREAKLRAVRRLLAALGEVRLRLVPLAVPGVQFAALDVLGRLQRWHALQTLQVEEEHRTVLVVTIAVRRYLQMDSDRPALGRPQPRPLTPNPSPPGG